MYGNICFFLINLSIPTNNSGNIKFNVRSVDGASVPNVSEEKLGGPYKLDVIAPSIDSTKEKGDYEGSKRSLRHAERSAGNRAVVPGRGADGILRKGRNKE